MAQKRRRPRHFDTESFIAESNVVHGDKYDYHLVHFQRAIDKVTIVCPEHGAWEQVAYSHLRGYGCPKCFRQSRRSSTKTWIAQATQVHGDLYDYSQVQYVTNSQPITILCRIHGPYSQAPYSHLAGRGCSHCLRVSEADFIRRAESVHGKGKYGYGELGFTNTNSQVTIHCPHHGPFQQRAGAHLSGQGCRSCYVERTQISYSKVAIEWLNSEAKRRNIFIQHAENGGEKVLTSSSGKGINLDGFCEATNQAFEFHGSFWHAHPTFCLNRDAPHACVKGKTNEEVYQASLKRDAEIRKTYELVVMWEHDWNRIKNSSAQPITISASTEKSRDEVSL